MHEIGRMMCASKKFYFVFRLLCTQIIIKNTSSIALNELQI